MSEDNSQAEDVDMSHYTSQMWFDEIYCYLKDVMSMSDHQIKAEFEKRFPELLIKEK
jgi:hypothetical protein